MPATKTGSITERLKAILTSVRDIAAKADDEGRDLTAEERQTIETSMAEANALKSRAKLDTALTGLEADITTIEGDPAGSTIERAAGQLKGRRSMGAAFMADEKVKAWHADITAGGAGLIANQSRIQSPALGFNGLKAFGFHEGTGPRRKGLITGASDTSAGALVDTDFLGLVDEGTYERELTLLDVVTRGTTESDTVEYTRVNTVDNQAAPVAEATSAAEIGDGTGGTVLPADGGVKPESDITLEKVSTTVKTIAHWLPATRRALSDAGQVRTLIDNFLRYGLFEELEDQIANGDGSGENFTGILQAGGVQGPVTFSTTIIETARKAKTLVKTVGRARANAYLLHPNDAEKLDLEKDAQGRFYFNMESATILWRLPVIESEAIAEGTGLVGDFRQAVIWDREAAAVTATDSHSDFFVRNLVAILAELRAAFGIIRPSAFVKFATA